MCRGKNHGGRRCPHDTSDKRRLRRKAAKARTIAENRKQEWLKTVPPTPETLTLPAGQVPTIEEIIEEAQQLREQANNPNFTAEEHALFEKQLTTHGLKIAALVEQQTGVNPEETKNQVEQLENELFVDAMEQTEITFDAREEAFAVLHDTLTPATKTVLGEDWGFGAGTPNEETLLNVFTEEEKDAYLAAKEADKAFNEAQETYEKAEEIFNSKAGEIYATAQQKLKNGYVEILNQTRGVGGELNANSTDPDMVRLVNDTIAAHYPTQWLKQNNEYVHQLVVQEAKDRPAFKEQHSETVDDGIMKPVKTAIKITATENLTTAAHHLFPNQIKTVNEIMRPGSSTRMFNITQECDDEELYNEQTHGVMNPDDGWEYRPTIKSLTMPGLASKTDDEIIEEWGKPRWVRPITTTRKEEHVLSILAPGNQSVDSQGSVFSASAVAYHEFGHRMETVKPALVKAQQSFLARRAGKTGDTFYTQLNEIPYGGGLTHNAGFVDKYVGREYNTNHYEVFTTGIEALYGGSYGGLTGLDINYGKPDNDHRGFILGALNIL